MRMSHGLLQPAEYIYLPDDTQSSSSVGDPHGLELVVNKGELGAVGGDGGEDAGHPEHIHVLVRRLQLVEAPRHVAFPSLASRVQSCELNTP